MIPPQLSASRAFRLQGQRPLRCLARAAMQFPGHRARHSQRNYSDKLRSGEKVIKNKSAVFITPQKLDKEARHCVKCEVNNKNLTVVFLVPVGQKQNSKNKKCGQRFEYLRGINANAQRHPGKVMTDRIGEDHSQERRGGLAVIAARGITTQAANALRQGDAGHINIKNLQERQAINLDVPDRKKSCGGETAVKYAARLQGVPTENLARIFAVIIPVGQDEQNLGAQQADDQEPGAEIEQRGRVKPLASSQAGHGINRGDQSQGEERAISRHAKGTEINQYGVHKKRKLKGKG